MEDKQTLPKIYSSNAIAGFSFFFSTIFGAVLLYQNLKDIGKKKVANIILFSSILYSLVSLIIVNKFTGTTYALNIVGGVVLKQIFKLYFPNSHDKYTYKKIWKPLIISLIITIPFILVAIANVK